MNRFIIILTIFLYGCFSSNHRREYYETGELKFVTIYKEILNDTVQEFESFAFLKSGQISHYNYGNRKKNIGLNEMYSKGEIVFIGQCDYNGIGNGYNSIHFKNSHKIQVISFLENGKRQGLKYIFDSQGSLITAYNFYNNILLDSFNYLAFSEKGIHRPNWLPEFNYDSAVRIEKTIIETQNNHIMHRDQLTTVFGLDSKK